MDRIQDHLNRVSRSFAFCIEELDEPLKSRVGISYLLCRIADTIEDSTWATVVEQQVAFDEFMSMLSSRESVTIKQIDDWRLRFTTAGITPGEVLLLNDVHSILVSFHEMNADTRSVILKSVQNMVRGMRHFSATGSMRLQTIRETNEYCFFVAGVVGELLTDLCLLEQTFDVHKESTLTDSFHFGLFLQKVNLLKDQMDDEGQGRFLVVSRDLLIESLRMHARRAFLYIDSLPEKLHKYRIFCSWCLFLGLASLPYIQEAFVRKKQFKIPRIETYMFLSKVKSMVGDRQALKSLFEEKLNQVLPQSNPSKFSESGSEPQFWPLAHLYRGQLPSSEFGSLGLTSS